MAGNECGSLNVDFENVDELDEAIAALADVLCWHAGFRAANPGDGIEPPPGIPDIRRLKTRLQEAREKATKNTCDICDKKMTRKAQIIPF